MSDQPDENSSNLSEVESKFMDGAKKGDLIEVKQLIDRVSVDCCQKNGMTALMHASYKGSKEMVEFLLSNGANPNIDTHSDQYTPLMFATLSGSVETCRLLLEAGARPDAVNKINRTATQLGAFVGRHDCVSVINNFVQLDQIKYHTQKHGLEEQPKLKDYLAEKLHKFIVIPNLNPVKAVLFLEENMELIANQKEVSTVLEFECQNSFKNVNEVLSLKLHLFNFVLKKCEAWETNKEGKNGMKGFLRFLLKGREIDGFQMGIENVLREAIKSFPYAQSNLFQQIIRTLSPVTPGDSPTALAVITQSINGMQSADFSECCACCGTRDSMNKCSRCKMVRYCNSTCQKLHWINHKNFCNELSIQYERLQQEEKRREEEEKKRKVEESKLKEEEEKRSADEALQVEVDNTENRSKMEELKVLDEVDDISSERDGTETSNSTES